MTTKTSNRKLISIESAKDTDGTDLSIYKYEVEKNGKVKNMRGTVKFIGGDSGDFVADLQDYLGRKVKYVNKKD